MENSEYAQMNAKLVDSTLAYIKDNFPHCAGEPGDRGYKDLMEKALDVANAAATVCNCDNLKGAALAQCLAQCSHLMTCNLDSLGKIVSAAHVTIVGELGASDGKTDDKSADSISTVIAAAIFLHSVDGYYRHVRKEPGGYSLHYKDYIRHRKLDEVGDPGGQAIRKKFISNYLHSLPASE